jgi:hypothetical protein
LPPPVNPVPAVTDRELYPGAADELDVLQKIVFAVAFVREKLNALDAMLAVNNGDRLPTDVTTELDSPIVSSPAE